MRYAFLLLILTACASVPEERLAEPSPVPGHASPLAREYPDERPEPLAFESDDPREREYDLLQLLELVDESPALKAMREGIARETGLVNQGSYMPNPVMHLEADFIPIDDPSYINGLYKIWFSQRIETAGKAGDRVDAALSRRDEAVAMFFHERGLLLKAVARDFYQAVFARRNAESTARMLELKRDLYDKAKRLNDAGRLADQDLIPHQVAVQTAGVQKMRYEAEEKELLRRIEGLLGLKPGTVLACRGEVRPGAPPAPEEAWQAVLQHNCELIHLDRKVDTARFDLELQEGLAYPDLSVGLGFTHGKEMGGETGNFLKAFVDVPFPLVDRNQGGIESAEAAVREAGAQLETTARKLVGEWQGLYEQRLIIDEQRLLYHERIIPSLEKELTLVDRQVEAGRRPVQERLNAAVKLEEAVLAALRLDEELAVISVDMKYLTGDNMF
jgi:cobalt-zinc-cadmium efflux system outer membrane protein